MVTMQQNDNTERDIVSFLRDNLAKGYFDDSTLEGIDQLYSCSLAPLIHGMNMDNDQVFLLVQHNTPTNYEKQC